MAEGTAMKGTFPCPPGTSRTLPDEAWDPVLDCLPQGLAIVASDGTLRRINAELGRLLALAPGELSLPCPLREGACPAALVRLLNPSQATVMGPYAVTLELPGGEPVTLEVTPAPIVGSAGGSVSLVRDVTADRVQAEDRGLFMAQIVHELRAPIQHVMGFANILTDVDDLPEETLNRFLGHITDESRRMARLVDDLTELSRLEQGRFSVDRQHVRVDQLLSGLLSRLSPSACARGVDLTLDTPSSSVWAQTDFLRLEQVVSNVIENALKFVPRGGRIGVSLLGTPTAWLIRVHDTGPGVPAEALVHLFDEYYQAPQREGAARNGMGLGLYISKQIVLALGGSIWAESAPDVGATFTILLPRD